PHCRCNQPVFSSSAPCPLCEQKMDHSLRCKKSGDRITRHNNVRNLVFKLADTGLLSPELEKLGILGPTDKSRRRPGDVSIKNWSLHRGLAIDVAVIHPLAASHLHSQEPCESYAKTQKTDAPAFVNFCVRDGAVNKEGENVQANYSKFSPSLLKKQGSLMRT